MNSWQELLFAVPSQLGWVWNLILSVGSFSAAAVMFFTMILHHDLDALWGSRVTLGMALLTRAFVTLQPGLAPWSDALFVIGALWSTLLIATGWCHREDKSVPMWRAILRWVWSVMGHLAGGVDHRQREDAL